MSSSPGRSRSFLARCLQGLLAAGLALVPAVPRAQESSPILIGFDAEASVLNSTSHTAIERGIRVAIAEINDAGGLLGGRRLELVVRDNRASPARGIANVKEFAAMPGLVAVFGGRFSPVVVETVKAAHESGLITLAPWSSADDIVENGLVPNPVFRIGLYDRIAMPAMIEFARKRGARRIGLLLANTSWGRSNLLSAERHVADRADVRIATTVWYNWGETLMAEYYNRALAAGAEAILLVANDREGALLVKEVAGMPPEKHVPIVSHWGVTGGGLVARAGADNLAKVDFAVVQSFGFPRADPKALARVTAKARAALGIERLEATDSPVGFGHAYDLTHILARAIALAGSTDRARVRDALERVENYDGLARRYRRPFAPDRHEAATAEDVFFAKYGASGVLTPIAD